ncbi:SulP family inorganic anion transporter [Methylobacterium sp. JK268]
MSATPLPASVALARLAAWRPSSDALRRDLVAGLTVAAISLPQGMAYALLAGVDPRYGLYSAIVVTLIASLLGSSSHLINGPTSAISLLVFSALGHFDPDARGQAAEAMFLLGTMVGAIQILIAVFRLGDLTRYISESVILGFMAGASVLLAVSQIGNALGLKSRGHGDQGVLVRLWLTVTEGGPISGKALTLSLGAVVLAVLFRRIVRRYRLPQLDMLAALTVVALLAFLAGWTAVGPDGRTAVGVAGVVPASLPSFHVAEIRLSWLSDLGGSALAIAFMGLLEALAIAKSIAHETRQPLDYNRQCMAEGAANLVGGFFQCLPGSGSLSRSAINYQAGARTRFSGVVVALAVAVALLAFAPLTQFIPKAALAGLLFVTAARLIDVKRLARAIRGSGYDAGLVAATAGSALLLGVEFSILVGVALSILLFVPRAAKLKVSELIVTDEGVVRERVNGDAPARGLIVLDLEGELFFGAAPDLEQALGWVLNRARAEGIGHVVVRLKRARHPDVVCLDVLEQFLRDAAQAGVTVRLAGAQPDLLALIRRLGVTAWFPDERIFPEEDERDSATLKAVRQTCAALEAGRVRSPGSGTLYYLV